MTTGARPPAAMASRPRRTALRPGRGEPGAQDDRGLRRQVAQAVPLRVKLAGTASLAVQVPWKPSEVLPPAAIVAL
jgi:hypothetical protein